MQTETSREAYLKQHPEKLRNDYKRILGGLEFYGKATYEMIAGICLFHDPNSVSRRLKEMVDLGLIEKLNEKAPTKRGARAYLYAKKV